MSACLAGEIPRALSRGDYPGAKEAALQYRDIFGPENFFLELQDHGLPEQKRINPQIIRLSRETGIPLVCTNDCHYIAREDSKMHKVLLCIQTGRTVEDEDTLEFGSDEFYLKTEEQMRALFPDAPEAVDNTAKIAQRCRVELEFGRTKYPAFTTPDGTGNQELFPAPLLGGPGAPLRGKPQPGAAGQALLRDGRHHPDGLCQLLPHCVGLHPPRPQRGHPRGAGPRLRGGQRGRLLPGHHQRGPHPL